MHGTVHNNNAICKQHNINLLICAKGLYFSASLWQGLILSLYFTS